MKPNDITWYDTTMKEGKARSGILRFLKTVGFSRAQGFGSHGFTGQADVYEFTPDDPRCKVTHAAVVRGLTVAVMCSEPGNVGTAILRSAGILDRAKNAGVAAGYDTFPSPIGCPAALLQGRRPKQALIFHRKR